MMMIIYDVDDDEEEKNIEREAHLSDQYLGPRNVSH